MSGCLTSPKFRGQSSRKNRNVTDKFCLLRPVFIIWSENVVHLAASSGRPTERIPGISSGEDCQGRKVLFNFFWSVSVFGFAFLVLTRPRANFPKRYFTFLMNVKSIIRQPQARRRMDCCHGCSVHLSYGDARNLFRLEQVL